MIICVSTCDLCRGPKYSHVQSTGLHMWADMWINFGLHPVQLFTFAEQSIESMYIWHNVILSYVLLPVPYDVTVYVASHVDWLGGSPSEYIYISRAVHCNYVSPPNLLLSFVLLPVTYVETSSIHGTREHSHICCRLCGPALGFTLSGYLHFWSNTL
jgi:hypothetical protein